MPAPAITTSKCSVETGSAARICVWTFISPDPFAAPRTEPPERSGALGRRSDLPPAEERQPLEQMHVLLVFQERAVQRRDQLAWIALPQHFRRDVLVEQELQPVEQFRG